jgi:hypothetical protein
LTAQQALQELLEQVAQQALPVELELMVLLEALEFRDLQEAQEVLAMTVQLDRQEPPGAQGQPELQALRVRVDQPELQALPELEDLQVPQGQPELQALRVRVDLPALPDQRVRQV